MGCIAGCRQLLSSKSPYRKNNLNFIACLTNPDVSQKPTSDAQPRAIKISRECENIVWKYKVAVTQDPNFIKKVQEVKKMSKIYQLKMCSIFLATDLRGRHGPGQL